MINFETATRAIWDNRPDIRNASGAPDNEFYRVIPEWWCLASPGERIDFGGDLVAYALTFLGGSLGRARGDTCVLFETLWDCRHDLWGAFPYAVDNPDLIPRAVTEFWHGVIERNPTYHGDLYDYVAKGSGVDCGVTNGPPPPPPPPSDNTLILALAGFAVVGALTYAMVNRGKKKILIARVD